MTAEIRILVKQTAQGIIDIGQRLLEVRDRLEHGQFLHWIETEFGWKKSTAYNLINVASNFQQVGNFDFSSKVLYLLAAPSTPEPAREEALSLAGLGEALDDIKRICRDNPAAMDAIDRVTVGKVGAPEGNQNAKSIRDIVTDCKEESERGNSSQYALRKLRKDAPDLHEQVLNRKLSAHAAMEGFTTQVSGGFA